MLAITSTRIVGLIAVACAVVVAPQALALPLTAAQTARLGAQTEAQSFKGIDRYLRQQHAERMAQAGAETEAASFKGIDRYLRQQHTEPMAHAGAPAWLLALEAHSVALNRQHELGKHARAVHKAWGVTAAAPVAVAAATPAVQKKSDKAAVWNSPSCVDAAGYDSYKYSGDLCNLSAPAPAVETIGLAPAIESDKATVWSFPVFCNGQAQAEYDSGC